MQFDVLRPATYSVPPEIKSVVLVNNAFPYNPEKAHIASVDGEKVLLDTIRVDSLASIIIQQLKEDFDLRRFFDTVYVDTTQYNTFKSGKPYKPLEQSQIINICNQYGADAVLSVSAAEYGSNINVEDMGVEYFATMDVYGMIYWRLYDGYSTKALHAKVQRDTLFWSGVGADVNASVSLFPRIKDATIELGHYLGANYVDVLVPYWEPVERKVYIAGNQHFVNAVDWLNKDNRFEAEKLWGYVYAHGKEREKGRAANNIAVSMEARGELDLAMEWAYKSFEAFGKVGFMLNSEEMRTSKDLYLDMVRRQRDRKKLDEQIGGGK